MTVAVESDELSGLVEELAQMEHDYVSMEALIASLDSLGGRIAVEGISQFDANTIHALGDNIIGSRYPIGTFTSVPSKTNLKPALEGIFTRAQEIVWKILESIAEFITKIIDWVTSVVSSKSPAQQLGDSGEAWKKAMDERLKAVEKRLKEIDRDKELTPEVKVEQTRAVNDVAPAVQKQNQDQFLEFYTVVVRAGYVHTEKLVELMDIYTNFPVLTDLVSSVVRTIDTLMDSYNVVKQRPALEALLNSSKELAGRFNTLIHDICSKLNRIKIEGMHFGHYDKAYPDEFLANVRAVVMRASKEPSGRSHLDDFKGDYEGAMKRMMVLQQAIQKAVDKKFQNENMPKELHAVAKRIQKLTGRAKKLDIEMAHDQIAMRAKLVEVTTLLRRSLIAFLRLRELPTLITRPIVKFNSLNVYSEEFIAKKIAESKRT